MTAETYRKALKQAKADLAEQVAVLGQAQERADKAEKAIVELRQTIAALQRLCGEPEFVEEDALGLTEAIRMAFRTADRDMSAHDVREQMESMGYAGRWGNLLASIHTVIPRLHKKGDIVPAGNLNGRELYRWRGPRGVRIPNAFAERIIAARGPTVPSPPGSPGVTLPNQSDLEDQSKGGPFPNPSGFGTDTDPIESALGQLFRREKK
jgi:hypothetical protein